MLEAGKRGRLGRYFFALMAFLFIATAAIGFAPNSVSILMGETPNPPLIIHAHAIAMATWLLLLFTQGTLVALDRTYLHRQLGMAIVVLAPVIVVMMCVLA